MDWDSVDALGSWLGRWVAGAYPYSLLFHCSPCGPSPPMISTECPCMRMESSEITVNTDMHQPPNDPLLGLGWVVGWLVHIRIHCYFTALHAHAGALGGYQCRLRESSKRNINPAWDLLSVHLAEQFRCRTGQPVERPRDGPTLNI
jgi:hypothetical protein